MSENRSSSSINKPLIVGIVIAVGVAAFFAGVYVSDNDSDKVTKAELNSAISRIESKIDRLQVSDNQPKIVKISIDDDPIRGNPDAPITIIEFSDYQCPFCAKFYVQTLPLIIEEYIEPGKVNLVYRDFPIQSSHPNAMPAAVAAECANDQGKYWEYHDILFERQQVWNNLEIGAAVVAFKQFATDIGLDQTEFDSCLDNGKYLEEVRNDLNDGREYGVDGTPGFFVGNEQIGFVKLSGAQPFESFKKVIDSQLNQ
ncbi:MAG: DsbA family protein [Nitrosopumilaceae archaeon]|nr:DsbA family protein [Nitrosopumilaceae archaeon]